MPPFCSFRDMPKMRFGCLAEASFPIMRTFPRKNKILAVNPYPFTLTQQHKFSSKISVLHVVKYLHYPDGAMDQISRTEIEASTIYKGRQVDDDVEDSRPAPPPPSPRRACSAAGCRLGSSAHLAAPSPSHPTPLLWHPLTTAPLP